MIQKLTWEIGKEVTNTIRGIKNIILRTASESLKPKWIVFEVIDRCNSRCTHCNIWRRESTEDILTPEEIEQTFRDSLFKDVSYVIVTGGEPTIRDDLEDIFLRIHKVLPKATLQLSTNGLLPDRIMDITKNVLAHDISFDIGISLDGIGEEHDRIRGVKGNFEKIDKLLHKLVNMRKEYTKKLNLSLGIVLSDHTLYSFKKVRAYAKELDIMLVEQWYNDAPYYDNIRGKKPIGNKIIEAVESQPPSPLQEKWLQALKGKSIKFPCFALYTFFLLKCNGDVAPCLRFSNVKTGNIRENTPSEIWHGFASKKARQLVKNCQGCLNGWGVGWSVTSAHYPALFFHLKHPRILKERWNKKYIQRNVIRQL